MLMLISMLLLTGFSIYWLNSQAGEQKKLLHEELERIFTQAGEEIVDSLLMEVYIRPVLDDSVQMTISMNDTAGEVQIESVTVDKTIDHIRADRDSVHGPGVQEKVMVLSDTAVRPAGKKVELIHASGEGDATVGEFAWNEEDMLVRSFKLVLSHGSSDSLQDQVHMIRLDDEEHSALLRERFGQKLAEFGYSFPVEWTLKGKEKKVKQSSDRMMVSGKGWFSESAIISGVLVYLLQQLLPQLLFVMVLLGLTFTAFLLMYRSMKKQFELNELRQDLVSNLTHELKTPVSTMKVALEALDVYKAGDDPLAAKEYMGIANEEINRLDSLIARMLDLVSLENRGRMVEKEKIDLAEVVAHSLEKLGPGIERRGAIVSTRGVSRPAEVTGVRFEIEAALVNILDNSLKYCGEQPEIELSISVDGKVVRLEIRDNGPGIPRKYAEKIFDKFFRVPTGDVHDVKGHGLGLSYAAQVMKQHGGTIRQENRSTGGSLFILEFRNPNHGS